MQRRARIRLAPVLALGLLGLTLGGCGHSGFQTATMSDQECMARVMYFESLRSSDDGMRAVGTVVMNRLSNPRYPKSVCGVVGQNKQFADGALTKHVDKRSTSWTRATRIAENVLGGERHEPVGSAMFFHTVGYSYPYRNMKYVTLAGGNAFYEKQTPGTFRNTIDPVRGTMFAQTPEPVRAKPTMLAAAEENDVVPAPIRTTMSDALPAMHSRAAAVSRGSDLAEQRRSPARPPVKHASAPEPRRPVVLASAASPRAPEPPAPAVDGRRSAAALQALRGTDAPRSAPLPPRLAEKPKPIIVAALASPAKPRPAGRARSIEELIAMDLNQQ